jgi:predicted nuclease of restriction endonuclease-like RecB superfamily
LVLGHDPQVDVFCGLNVKVEDEALFEDYWCRKWISAKMKMQANKLLTLYNVTLVGGVTINMAPLTEEASKDMEECIEHWKDTNTMSRIWTIP